MPLPVHCPASGIPLSVTTEASQACEADLGWVNALRKGDDMALDAIMVRWEKPLFSFAWRYVHNNADAHDLVAETFVRLHKRRSELHPDTRLSAWLFTTLSNLCHNHHRWCQRHPTVSMDSTPTGDAPTAAERIAAPEALPPERLAHQEDEAALRAAVDRLPHDLKTTLLLHHYERLSYRDIARILGCSERGVETRLYRARSRLRIELSSWIGS